ncbi:RNA polymerase sigma-70 factor [Flagellimonas marinaquae]|uniref:RNA polymerase sigma-70 factor n=1 Tax=Flagellimonas marinaquae TaxID=254955 RepID=UPI0021D11FC2|nr:RNA polymerase sigma-70 factor [Allomuricauda aquimarina]
MQPSKGHKLKLNEFNRIYEKTYTPLCLFANHFLEDLETSKDVVQEVFVKIWEDKIEFINENTIKSYLYTSVRNRSLDYLRSNSYRKTFPLTTKKLKELETEPFFLREIVVVETSDIIENAINTLPEKCAKIIRLSAKGLTNANIAEKLGLSVNTVKTQKKIAFKRLKPILKEHFFLITFFFGN